MCVCFYLKCIWTLNLSKTVVKILYMVHDVEVQFNITRKIEDIICKISNPYGEAIFLQKSWNCIQVYIFYI